MTLEVNNLSGFGVSNSVDGPIGHKIYDTPGSHSWTVPDGVTSVCVVCIGAGGKSSSGGGGGGLGWRNNIKVTPGESISISVGDSWFKSNTLVRGGLGGSSRYDAAGGDFTGAGGGRGGRGGPSSHGTGAGAGGYKGKGGDGIYMKNHENSTNDPMPQTGSGAGAGNYYFSPAYAGGGGVGLYGHGLDGFYDASTGIAHGGSGGDSGRPSVGGDYGGGSGYTDDESAPGGGKGAVRIIWGPGRSFPYNAQRVPTDID